jgi:hypothetical protein
MWQPQRRGGNRFVVACTALRLTEWVFFFEFRNCLRIPIDTVLEERLELVDWARQRATTRHVGGADSPIIDFDNAPKTLCCSKQLRATF